MSKKVNWANVDKRIRERNATWSHEERAALEANLMKLPDLEEECEVSEIPQPAVGDPQQEAEGEPEPETAPQVEAPN